MDCYKFRGKEIGKSYKHFGGIPWSEIGYDKYEDIPFPEFFEDGLEYAKKIQILLNGYIGSLKSRFDGDAKLVFFPQIDMSGVTNMEYTFSDTTNLLYIPELNTENVESFYECFSGCINLIRIEGISVKSWKTTTNSITGTSDNIFWGMDYSDKTLGFLRYALIKDIGTVRTTSGYDFYSNSEWGIDSDEAPDARQSLIDSLLTYSFDRRAAGYSDCKIILAKKVKAVLSQEEIDAIQAKGFILTTERYT